jgi:TniQ protein
MNRPVPLPLAPPPYPAEALHSWLRRVAAPYKLTPRQLLHAVRVHPYEGSVYACPHVAVQSALEPPDLRYLARLARCDPSRLGLDASRMREWLLVRDEWMIICPQCIRSNLDGGNPAYERTVWRLATCSFCPRHRTPLVQVESIPQVIQDIEYCERNFPAMNDLEQIVAAEIFEFEREIDRAFRGIAPPHFEQTLTAAGFLQVLRDLCTFVVELWDVDMTHTVASSLDQHTALLTRCSDLFDCRRPRGFSRFRADQTHASLAQIADPATRRAALWLVMQVIRLAPTPRPTHAMHLGYTAQDDFFGDRRHAGWAWLATQAQEWPAPYRTHFWAGFQGRDDTLKGTNDSLKGTECH